MRRILLVLPGMAMFLALTAIGCGGSASPTQPSQTSQGSQASQCAYSATNQTPSAPAEGASMSSTMTRTAGTCGWSASSDAPWLTIAGSNSGTEGGTLTYAAAANTTASSRTGHITVSWSGGSMQITVTQAAAGTSLDACTYVVSDTSPANFTVLGGTGSATTTVTGNNCTGWTAQTTANWIHITSGASGPSTGTIRYSIDANTGAARTDRIVVTYPGGSTSINISQSGTGSSSCSYSVGDTSPGEFPVSGGTSSASVVVNGSGCGAWNAATSAGWIHVTAGASASTSGTIRYTVDANGSSARSDRIVVTYPGGSTDIKISQATAPAQAVLSVSPQPCDIKIASTNLLMCTFDGSASFTPTGTITNYEFKFVVPGQLGSVIYSGPNSRVTNYQTPACGGVPGTDFPLDVTLTVTTPLGTRSTTITAYFHKLSAC